MINESQSFKAAWNKYKTDHYHSHHFKWTTFDPNTSDIVETMFSQGNNKKTHVTQITIVNVTNVSDQWTIDNGIRLVEAFPGTAWGTGQSVSHRGMDGDFVRFECN